MTVAKGELIRAHDINKMNFFPAGTILAYDGTTWQDNVTLEGWYACTATNAAAGLTPDLEDRFIMGGVSPSIKSGNNTISLSAAHLPEHTHDISAVKLSEAGGHKHGIRVNITRNPDAAGTKVGGWSSFSLWNNERYWNNNWASNSPSTASAGDHRHTIVSGNSNETGNNAEFAIRPHYYTVVYIKKVH
jgi:hypothetical protein